MRVWWLRARFWLPEWRVFRWLVLPRSEPARSATVLDWRYASGWGRRPAPPRRELPWPRMGPLRAPEPVHMCWPEKACLCPSTVDELMKVEVGFDAETTVVMARHTGG